MIKVALYLFVIGCCLGSFINVVIYRLPLNQSVVYPNSSCPKCGSEIKPFDNIPIISWLLLGAKCRFCNTKISSSYPIIEFFTGILFSLNIFAHPTIYVQQPIYIQIILGCIFCTILIPLAILDFKYLWLPQSLTLSGIVFGIISSLSSLET